MKSLRELYRIGRGPSSSHTMGPAIAAERFLRETGEAARYEVEDWNGKRSEVSGAELKNFRVKLEKPRSFAVFFYKKI